MRRGPQEPVWVNLGLAVAFATGLVLRFWAESPLWLDEALSVNIARLPLAELPDALRRDGAPPIYYALLHGWMNLFGEGSSAVRAFSGVLSVISLPLMYLAGRRVAGREGGWTAAALLATSPFALRYATETRMYSLVTFLTLVGFLGLDSFLRRPTVLRLALVMLATASLVLTHYWALFLAGAVLLVLATHVDRIRRRFAPSWAMVGVGCGLLALLPWLPVFLFQVRHTGTPWAKPAHLSTIFAAFFAFGGSEGEPAAILGPILLGFAVLGSIGHRYDRHRVLLDLRGAPVGRGLWGVALGTLVAAVGTSIVSGAGFAPRYAAVVLVPFLLLVTLGANVLADVRVRRGVVAVLVVLGLGAAAGSVDTPRTQAGQVARVLNARAQPGDLVAYCPDQLGPAVDRLVRVPVRQTTFPGLTPPKRINWVDYERRVRRADPARVAGQLHDDAGSSAIWLVWALGYRPFGGRCERLDQNLANVRPDREVHVLLRPDIGPEHSYLTRYRVPPPPPTTTTTTSTTEPRRRRR